jgi:hypothetical protein
MVASSVWRSRKFRALTSDAARLAYFYLHTTTHGNSAGVFVLPPEMAAVEMRVPAESVRSSFAELNAAGLIRYDPEEELVQITNFFRFNVITSRKHLAGPLRMVRSMPHCWVKQAAACDLVVAIHDRARGWDKTIDAKGPFMQEAANLIREMHLEPVICSPEIGLPMDLLIALSDDLLIALPIQGNGNGNGNKTDTDTDTRRRQDGDKTEIRESFDRAPTDPLADGSRPGRYVPEDIGAQIANLQAKTKGKA